MQASRGGPRLHPPQVGGGHAETATIRPPVLDGNSGMPPPLSGGIVVTANDQYLRDSILLPNKQIAAGYEPLMQTYQNRVSEEDLTAVIAYLKSLGSDERKNR